MSQDRDQDRLDLLMVQQLAQVIQREPATEHRFSVIDKIEVQHYLEGDTVVMLLILENADTGRVGYMVPFIAGAKPKVYSMTLLSYVDQHEQFRTVRKDRREIERLILKKVDSVATILADKIIENNFVGWYGIRDRGDERYWVDDWLNRSKMNESERKELCDAILSDLDDRSMLTSEIERALPRILNV